jgi:hypothetical protein
LQANVFTLGVTPHSGSVCASGIGTAQFGQAIGHASLRLWDSIAFININVDFASAC